MVEKRSGMWEFRKVFMEKSHFLALGKLDQAENATIPVFLCQKIEFVIRFLIRFDLHTHLYKQKYSKVVNFLSSKLLLLVGWSARKWYFYQEIIYKNYEFYVFRTTRSLYKRFQFSTNTCRWKNFNFLYKLQAALG